MNIIFKIKNNYQMKNSIYTFCLNEVWSTVLRHFALVVLFICPHFIIGQITVTSTTFPAAGDKLRYKQASNPNVAISLFTPPGGNQAWNLSTLTESSAFETNYRPATEGANAAAFPSATMVVINGTDEYYYRSSSSRFDLLGQASTTVGGLPLKALYINQPVIAVRHSPLNFFDIYQQSSSNSLAWAFNEIPNGAINSPITPDSIRLRISNQIVEAVDGWGTLTLPGSTPQPQFPVLRLKKTTYHEQRIDAKIPPLGWLDVTDNVVRGGTAWANLFGVDTTVTHHYFNDVSKEEIAILTFNNEQNGVISVVYKNAAAVNNPCPSPNTLTVNVSNQTVCAGASVPSIIFSSDVQGAVFSWSRTNEAIGLGINSGTGNIPAFNAMNSGTTPLTATFSVVASITNNGVTCTGTPVQFTVTVNPSPTINAISNKTACAGASVPSVVFSSNIPGATFSWSRTNEAIGLGINSGTGNIPAFTAINSGITPLTATFSAVASFTNNGVTCTGTPIQFTITVNPFSTPSVSIGVSSNPICLGTTITFTAVPINGGTPPQYQWYKNSGILNGETGNTLITNSLAANDKIKVGMTSAATCVSPLSVESNEITMMVKTPSVAPTGITGISTICNDGNTTLTLVGGSAGTGATSEWFSGSCGGTPAGIGKSITVSPSISTTYFVRFNGDCNTTSCASQLITVNTLSTTPTSISGVTTICQGSSTTLSASGGFAGTGAIAEWFTGSCGGTPIGTGNSMTFTPTINTTYFVRYKGICNTTTCASVAVNITPPSVGGTLTPAQSQGCGPQTVNLSVSGINGVVTQWERQTNCSGAWASIGNAGLSAITVTTPNSSTCYRAVVTNGVCPSANSTTSTITVDKPAVGGRVTSQSNQLATSIALCPNQNAVLIPLGFRGIVANWQYTFGTSSIWYDLSGTEGQQSLTINGSTVISTTFYRVVITSALGICTGTASVAYSSAFRVNKKLSCLSPDGNEVNTDVTTVKGFKVVQAYPNPATAVLTLQLENLTEGITQFEIMDITGKIVKIENKHLPEGYNEVTLDIQNLSNGLHFIKVKDNGNHEAVVKMSKM